MELLQTFVRRLKRIGIEVTFVANYPWIYLDTVNGVKVKGTFMGNHGFTAFFLPVKLDRPMRFTDIRMVFSKIRQIINGETQDDDYDYDGDYYN